MNYKAGLIGGGEMTVCNVRNVDADTIEIIKRRNPGKPWFYKWGVDQQGVFERVIINRKECSVAVDRIDTNFRIAEPFLGQRDYFYVETKDKEAMLNMTSTKDR